MSLSSLALFMCLIVGIKCQYNYNNRNPQYRYSIPKYYSAKVKPQNYYFEPPTPCELYGRLCFAPQQVSRNMSIQRFNELAVGTIGEWTVILGNDIARLHLGSETIGRQLDMFDNFEGMCLKIEQALLIGDLAIGAFNGFGRRHANIWRCKSSKDFKKAIRCTLKSQPSQYSEDLFFYFTDTARKNVHVVVLCYPNGDVGWHSLTLGTSLTKADEIAIKNQVVSLGFSRFNVVSMYDSSCDDDSIFNSY